MSARTLKIEATGDFFRHKVAPKIRLAGQWLERAVFKPGHRVQVALAAEGVLTVRLVPSQQKMPSGYDSMRGAATAPIGAEISGAI